MLTIEISDKGKVTAIGGIARAGDIKKYGLFEASKRDEDEN